MLARRVALGAVLLLALASFAPLASAIINTPTEGCTKLVLQRAGGSIHWIAGTSATVWSDTCASGTYHLAEGECVSPAFYYSRTGSTPPTTPAAHGIYWFLGTTNNDHAATGKDNWGSPVTGALTSGAPTDGSRTYCATSDGTSTGTPVAGTYRLVLRLCDISATCTSGLTTYDVNTDTNPTCACSGTTGAGNSVTATPGYVTFSERLDDPLWVAAAGPVYVGETVNLTIHSEYDNGDFRADAQTDIFVYVKAPDLTYLVSGTNPTQATYPGTAKVGNYYTTFTASQEGVYHVMVRLASDDRSAKPLEVRAIQKPLTAAEFREMWTSANTTAQAVQYGNQAENATQQMVLGAVNYLATLTNATSAAEQLLVLTAQNYLATRQNETTAPLVTSALLLAVQNYLALHINATNASTQSSLATILANIQDANNTSSGALSYATFRLWNEGEFRPTANTTNGTARETSITLHRNATDSALAKIYDRIPAPWSERTSAAWAKVKPPSQDAAVLFVGMIACIGYGTIGWRKSKHQLTKTYFLVAGAILAGLYWMNL